jgi:hypothetical protein
MRALAIVALLAGCRFGAKQALDGPGGSDGARECSIDGDCVLAAATCCDCPTYAVGIAEPTHQACGGISCPVSTCPNNVQAICDDTGACALACSPVACAVSCPLGYVLDVTGCLECACADVAAPACASDGDCVRTRADCCGCQHGGADTAVPAGNLADYDAGLGCSDDPVCPQTDSCAAGLAARCIEGACELAPALPAGACGRDDLMACPGTTRCTINSDADATLQGVGVCM